MGVESNSATVWWVKGGPRLFVPIGAADAVIDVFSLPVVSDLDGISAPQLTGFLLISEPWLSLAVAGAKKLCSIVRLFNGSLASASLLGEDDPETGPSRASR